jgi:3-dehydroquinate dehydratase-2
MSNVLIINGPNLNLLGTREPEIYGSTTLAELDGLCVGWGAELGLAVTAFQSNHEGAIIDRIQAAAGEVAGIVINAGALTHYSYALYDALVAVGIPAVEVHISDIHSREEWRRRSVIQAACLLQISGEGLEGYRRALAVLAEGGW